MVGLDHGSKGPKEEEDAEVIARNSRNGLSLFFLYLLLYGGYVLVNTFSPETMEITPLEGVNLAVLSGFGLIIAALVMAIIYGWLCRAREPADL